MSADPLPISAPLIAGGVATLLAGLFACADTALTSLTAARLGALAKEAKPRYQRTLARAVSRRSVIQARYLAWRVVCICWAAASGTLWLSSLSLSMTQIAALAVGGLLLVSVVIEVCSAVGRRAADFVVPIFSLALTPFELVIAPVAFLTFGFARLLNLRKNVDPQLTETEVEIMVDQGERSGALEQEPAELIRNVLEFSELTARDAMVPRTRVIAIKLDTPFEKVLQTVTEAGHSRYPVYREDMDDIFGLLYAKDLFRVLKQSWRPPPMSGNDGEPIALPSSPSAAHARLLDIVREQVKFVSETQPLSALLQEMRLDRQHVAIVVDEYGGTSGLVTLEDVLEEIVGDIQDEFDSEEAPIVHDNEGRLIADAAVPLSDLSAYLGSELDPDGQYESLGGMLTDKAGEVPAEGTAIRVDGMRFIIHKSDEKHISKVVVERSHADTSGPHSAQAS